MIPETPIRDLTSTNVPDIGGNADWHQFTAGEATTQSSSQTPVVPRAGDEDEDSEIEVIYEPGQKPIKLPHLNGNGKRQRADTMTTAPSSPTSAIEPKRKREDGGTTTPHNKKDGMKPRPQPAASRTNGGTSSRANARASSSGVTPFRANSGPSQEVVRIRPAVPQMALPQQTPKGWTIADDAYF